MIEDSEKNKTDRIWVRQPARPHHCNIPLVVALEDLAQPVDLVVISLV
jgi:hypothetical protein